MICKQFTQIKRKKTDRELIVLLVVDVVLKITERQGKVEHCSNKKNWGNREGEIGENLKKV